MAYMQLAVPLKIHMIMVICTEVVCFIMLVK